MVRRNLALVLWAVFAATPSTTWAASIPTGLPTNFGVDIAVVTDTDVDFYQLDVFENGDGTYSGGSIFVDSDQVLAASLFVNPDPFVNAVFALRNNTAVVQNYTVAVVMNVIPPIFSNTIHGGSVGITLTDANFNGFAQVSSVGTTPVYMGQMDLVTILPLMNAPFSMQVNVPGRSNTTSAVLGLPGPTLPSGPVINTIGIVHRFSLTPGDTVGFTSFFVVEPVPEASTFCMVGGALVAAWVARRRALSSSK